MSSSKVGARFKDCTPKGADTEELLDSFLSKNVLFYIDKNTNTNCVVYEANLTEDGKLDEKEPVKSYWISYAGTPVKEEKMSFLERKNGYGHSSKKHPKKEGHFEVTLKAFRKLEMEVFLDEEGLLHAQMDAEGEIVELISLFTHLKTSWGIPKVVYVDLSFQRLNGERFTKRIENK